jgi:hypothetical protein
MILQTLSRATILRVGMASLLAAVVVPRLLASTGTVNPDLIDGIQGLLWGISIGFNLLWVRETSRQRRGNGS